MAFLLTLFLVPSYGYVDWQSIFQSNYLYLLILMTVLGIASNVLIYQSLQTEMVHKHEVIIMLTPLVTIILAAAFFKEEFNLILFSLALISSLSLIIARVEKHHLRFNKHSYNLLLAVVLMSLETLILRELLFVYSPVSLYAVRTAIIGAFFLLYYRPKVDKFTKLPWYLLLATGAMGVVQMIGKYYALEELGVIFATMIMIISPLIVFLASWEILHEKIKPRIIAASAVILICVVLATVITYQV